MRALQDPRFRRSPVAVATYLLACLVSLQFVRADDTPPATIEFAVSPAAEPIPALKYHFLTPPEDQLPGNAVPIYLRIVFEQSEGWRKALSAEAPRLLELTSEEFLVDEADKLIDQFEGAFEQFSAASRRSYSDWEYVLEGEDPLGITLSDAQSMRSFARLIALKARVKIRQGDLPAAVDSLRDGFALGQNVADGPFLVNQLIGIAISDLMLSEIEGFLRKEDAPNLYWALAELPRPLVSVRMGLANESRMLVLQFPELAIPSASHNWQELANRIRDWVGEIVRMEGGADAKAAILALQEPTDPKRLAAARQELSKMSDFSAEQVAAMSDAELTVRHTTAIYRGSSDALRKWSYVPYPKSIPKFPEIAENLGREARRRELFPLVSLLSPALGNVLIAQANLDRRVTRLQAIEALRMHAAATGKFPKTLDEVTVVPVPLDPATGGPFAYKLEGDTATLDVTDLAGMQRDVLRMPVKLTLRK